MTDTASRPGIDEPFLRLLACLDASDDEPPLAVLLHAASLAVRKADRDAEEADDALTALYARGSRGLLMRTLQQLASKERTRALQQGSDHGHRNLEAMAANALELAIKALRHGLDVEAGLCQRLTAPQLYGQTVLHEDLTHLSEKDRRRTEACLAAWLALPSWEAPVGRDHDRRVVQVDEQLERLLAQTGVPAQVRRWLNARRASSARPAG